MTVEETNVPRCKYYINEEARKVVCVILDTKSAVLDYIYSNEFDNSFPVWNYMEELTMPNSFSGVATCSENDTFDVTIGKRIAYNKAKFKFNNSFFKRMQKYMNRIDWQINNMIDRVNAYGAKLTHNQERREAEIEDYFKKIENE